MRGGISLDDLYQLGPEDREILSKVIKENYDIAKKSGLPHF